jgi:very-short-patch-repair endonuclease
MVLDLDLEGSERPTNGKALVTSGGKLPHSFRVSTSKLLDVIVALSPRGQSLTGKQRKVFRQTINQKLYNRTRPGFYLEVGDLLHIAYAGQPQGANTQHQWHVFCGDERKAQVETLLADSALVVSEPAVTENGASGKHTLEWGGLYLRSEAELSLAQALNETGLLFFANARGRVGLQETLVSDSQLTGRVETDFMVFHQGKCLILEVDGQHHLEHQQIVRDYARDRVLLRAGLPTVRFIARDCLERPQDVVAEFMSILLKAT